MGLTYMQGRLFKYDIFNYAGDIELPRQIVELDCDDSEIRIQIHYVFSNASEVVYLHLLKGYDTR